MKGVLKNLQRLKRIIAWLLTAAIVTGNISQLTVTMTYAAETSERRTASSSNAEKASPSEASPSEASPSEARRAIDVRVTQSSIEKVLKRDFDSRPELKEELIPFKGEQKELVIQRIYEELEGKTLVLQKKTGKAMYMVVVSDTLDGEPFFETEKSERIKQESILQNIQIIGVNGYKDRACEFRLRIIGNDLTVSDAEMEEYAVVGKNPQEETVTKALASVSEAAAESPDQEEPDLISTGGASILSEDEKAALTGANSQPSFSMMVRSLGITMLNTEINREEEKLSPYETALTYYGPDATDEKEVVEIDLTQSKTGSIKAGILYTYTITYTTQAAPLYEYAAGGKLSLFDTYENARIEFTVPAGIALEEQAGKVKQISSNDDSRVYEIHIGDEQNAVRPGKSDSMTINAFIDGNGERAVGEHFSLSEDCVAFYAEVKVADKTDKDNVTYPGNIETVTYAQQPENTSLILESDDEWHIKKRVYPNDNSYTVVKDEGGNPEFIDITYLIEMGMYGSSGEISRQPGGTIYQTYGRTGFEKGSFQITDSLKISTPNAPEGMKPVSVNAKWGDGSRVNFTGNPDGSITIGEFKTQGQNGADHIFVSESAPVYSSYLVTARYPYEPFLLKYNDKRVGDHSVFTVNNHARLEYKKLGTSQKVTEDSSVAVAVHEVNKPAVIKIKKEIDEGTGVLQKYGLAMEKEYPGMAGFEIFSLGPDNNRIPYTNYTVIDRDNKRIDSGKILVNPSNGGGENGYYTTGEDGYIQIQVDPGTYIIKEVVQPEGTEFRSAAAGAAAFKKGEDIKVTLKAGENAEVTVVNGVIGKGAVKFYKKARTWDSANLADQALNFLEGAEFSLYKRNEEGKLVEVKAVKSDGTGAVLFKPVTPGQYIVREKSANGYIVDTKDYAVTVAAGQTAPIRQNGNYIVNTLNEAKVNVTKWIQDNQGSYKKVPEVCRGDFDDKFWFEKSTDGITWTKVRIDSRVTYSLDGSSRFIATLPVFDGDNRRILYRVAEEVPEGYSNGNGSGNGFSCETKENKTYVYKTFSLEPLKTTEVDLKNKKGGTLKLQKEAWSVTDGVLDKNASRQGYQFKLYADLKYSGFLYEVSPGTIYTTDSNGEITVKGLDVTKAYYWCEVGSDGRLEVDDSGKMRNMWTLDGMKPFIGPYKVNRESDTFVKAYNIPQKIPYWLYKVDITNKDNPISAEFKITKKRNGEAVWNGRVSRNGKFVSLEPGTAYIIEEITPPFHFEKGASREITTPSGPVTRNKLEMWFGENSKETRLTFENRPYQSVLIKKIQYEPGGREEKNARIPFEVYRKDSGKFVRTGSLYSNELTPLAPGTYYFKEIVPGGFINPYYLLSNKAEGIHPGYEVRGIDVYYGPVTVTAASASSEMTLELYLGDGNKPLENFQDYGKVTVTKKDALRNTALNGATLGIFRADQFDVNRWEESIKTPIQKLTTSGNGQVTFDSKSLKIFDGNGNRILYVIAEITPPAGYHQSYEILTTALKEGMVITTVNGDANGNALVIRDEPKLTIRTQKYWQDEWSSQFYPVDHVLGNVKLALYKVNQNGIAELVKTETTNAYDGIATFYDINRNDIYYVVEVRVPDREETGFDFDLNMKDKIPLAKGSEEPPEKLPAADLEAGKYNAVKYTGKDLANTADSLIQYTDPLYNYKDWVQFHILKTCDGIAADGTRHTPEPVNGAKFTLYKMKAEIKNLSEIRLEDLEDETRFEKAGIYESGTRIDPAAKKRADGEFDTAIVEAGRVYWLVEEEAAPGYKLPKGRQITAVFAPENSGYKDYKGMLHFYKKGRNDHIAVVKNQHGDDPGGLLAYYFQIAFNKWLRDDTKPEVQPTLLGGAKFQIWLADPETKEKLLPVEVVETGLESDGHYKTGYALSKLINMGKLKTELENKGIDPETVLKLDESRQQAKAVFILEEVYAPSKVQMDPALHYLEVTVPKNKDYIDEQYFWKKGKPKAFRLINTVSREYPVTFVKYGYRPDSGTFGKTDEELNGLNISKTPLSKVKLEVWQYQWKDTGYHYVKTGTYTTGNDGRVTVPGGLKAGHYRLKETLTGEQQKNYMTMYTGQGSLWRYFTVGSTPSTVAVYNPEKPELEIEKTTWNGDPLISLKGITFTIQKAGSSEIKAVTGKREDGRLAAGFKNLDSGVYTIKGEALSGDAAKAVTSVYFETSAVNVGYTAKAEGERVYLLPVGDSVTGKNVTAAVKNPRLAELVVQKTDAETKESGPAMAGASFQLEYLKFRSGTDLIGGVLQNVLDEGYEKPDQGFGTVAGSLTDNGDGTYSLKDCAPGWYRITEQKAPKGYTVSARPMVVAVVGDMGDGYDKTVEVTFENRKKAELTVIKRLDFGDGFRNDENIRQKLPSEAAFDVYTYSGHAYQPVLDEGNQPVVVKVRGFKAEDGYYTAEGSVLLPQYPEGGAYYLKEREHPDWVVPSAGGVENGTLWEDGYIQAGTGADFTSGSPVSILINNQYAKARIRLTKVDGENPSKKLSGAAFQLYTDSGLTVKAGDFMETGQSGVYEIVFSTRIYPAGTYYIKEVNAPAGYLAIKTAIPAEGLTVETGKESRITVQNQGGIDLQITKYSGNGGTESLKSGVSFELYRKSGSGSWNYVTEAAAGPDGKLAFRGLELPEGDSYAVYEVPEKEQGFETFRMVSFEGEKGTILPITADVTKNGVTRSGAELYVLAGSGTVSPGVYGFQAHNQEALPLKLIKNDKNKSDNPDGTISVFMKVTDYETHSQVGDLVAVPYGEAGKTIKLLPGTYEIEETAVTRNSQGYIINRDDAGTVYKKVITIKKGEIPAPCEFTNVKQKTGVTLDKTSSTSVIKDLWWNDGQTLTYTLTPHVKNSIPLDQFVINDTGLQMLDAGKNILPESEYTSEKYTITAVKPGKAAEQNRIKGAKTGTIMADVAFYDFSGNQVGQVQSVAVNGDGETGLITPAGGKKVKAFSIRYRDDTLKGSSDNQYILGQDFVPGSVEVTVKLSRQDAKLSNGNFKKEIKYIRNQADVVMSFRKWDVNGTLIQDQEKNEARADCDIGVVQSQAPVISVKKSVDPVRSIQPEDTLTYTLYVKNATTSDDTGIVPMRRPILIDHVPPGVTVSGESTGEDRLLKAVRIKAGPRGVTIEKTIRKMDAATGRETLFILLDGELKKNESVTVEVKAKIAGSIINYGKNILNELYVTSDVLQPAFSLNQTGASFMIETLTGSKWPSADLPEKVQLPDEKYRTYGYASDSAENTMSTGTGLILHKEVKGNLDTRFVSGTTVGKVAKSDRGMNQDSYDGTVLYRLTVNNASATDFVTQLQLMDILPVKGDYSTGNFERLSDYRLKFENIRLIAVENRTDNTAGRKVRDFDYQVTYSEKAFQNKETVREGKESMLSDNSDGFWSGNTVDPTAVRIKITDPEFYLAPGENLVVTYQAAVPYTTVKELDEAAYGYAVNDFAASYSYKKNLSDAFDTKFSQVQTSNAVQAVLVPGNVKVSGRIWIDDNNNGIQDESIEKDHLLTDLLPLLQSGYFNAGLLKYSKNGDDEVTGTVGVRDARFLFDGLTPAKPFGINGTEFTKEQEDSWYSSQSLIVSKLKGEDPAHYRIYVTTGTMPEGFEDLVLKLAKPAMGVTGENKEAGRSRLPQTLKAGGIHYEESLDSNFKEAKGSYVSEDFFLWSSADEYDTTKDIGFVPYRNVTVKKINKAGNPVEGAHFKAYGPFTNEEMDAFRETGITDTSVLGAPVAEGSTVLSDGEAVWNAGELLYYRNYILAEDGAPAGYQIADAGTSDLSVLESYQVNGQKAWVLPSKEFKTPENAVPSIITIQNSYVTGTLEFTKTDGLTGKELAGAAFRIEKKGAVAEDAWKAFTAALTADSEAMGVAEVEATDSAVEFKGTSGKVILTGIPYGSYTLSEIRVPDGYDITKKPADMAFHIESDGQKAVLSDHEGNRIQNTRAKYSLSLKKTDDAGNDKVSGIRFAITGPGKIKSSFWNLFGRSRSGYEVKETDGDGLVTWNLPYGDYRIEELDAAGYETVEPFYVRIGVNGAVSLLDAHSRSELTLNSADQKQINIIVKNRIKTGALTVEKVDSENRDLIAGAQFELSGTSVIDGAFADYLKHVTGLGVSHVSAGDDAGRLWLRFQVDGSSDSGAGLLSQIPYGSYTLKEVRAPEGYLYGTGREWKRDFKIESAEGIRLTGNDAVVNIPHEMNIEKRDKVTDAVLSGAVFVLMDADGKYVSLDENLSYNGLKDRESEETRFTTGSGGRVTVKRLPAGSYVLKEVEAPAGYAVSGNQPVTVLQSGNAETVVVYDVRNRAKIRINKAASHDHGKKLAGAVFGIYSDEGLTALAGTMTTGKDGYGESELLPLGTYYVKEQIAPAGYEAGGRVYEVTLKNDSGSDAIRADGNDFITNDYGTGSLVFDKVDSLTGEPLASARFSLTGKKTEVDGAFEHFAANLALKNQDELIEMGVNGIEVAGNVIRFTAVNGHVAMDGIPYGVYKLKEENAPKGYLNLNGKAEFDFVITENQRMADLGGSNQVLNERAQFELQLKKVDNFGRSISGMQFEILGPGRYQDGGIFSIFGANRFHTNAESDKGIFTTGDNGLIQLGLKHGDYQIREISSGRYDPIDPIYLRIDGEGNVRILKDNSKAASVSEGQIAALTITNKISTGNLELEKIDREDTGKRLNGAEFTITNLSTLVPGAWDSFRYQIASEGASWNAEDVAGNSITFVLNGRGVIANLPYGTYRLTETKAPDGYILGNEPWTAEFTINEAGKVMRYTAPALFTKTNGAIANEPSKITVIKTNAVYGDRKLKGAGFILKASDGRYIKLKGGSFDGYTDEKAYAGTFVTDSEGQFIIKRLPKDSYTFIETKAPAGYYINNHIPQVALDGINSFTVTIQDEEIRGSSGGGGGGRSPGGFTGGDPSNGPGVVTIIPDQVPLASLPGEGPANLFLIDDGNIPLANLPKTGGRKNTAGKVMVALSGFMMALYAALSKKKKEINKIK